MIIKVSFCFCDSKTAGKNGRGKIFRAGLAIASGYRDDFEREPPPVAGGELLIRLQSISGPNEGEGVRKFAVRIGFHDRPGRPRLRGGFNEIVSVEVFAAQSQK